MKGGHGRPLSSAAIRATTRAMFLVPPWVTFLVAAAVSLFGVYRLYIAFTVDTETLKERKGLYGLPRRTHLLVGIVYLIFGVILVASGLGYNPFRDTPEETSKSEWIEVPDTSGAKSGTPGAASDPSSTTPTGDVTSAPQP